MKFHLLTIPFLLSCPVSGTILFADNFNRPDNDDIDASSLGMSGLVGPLSYDESRDRDDVSLGLSNIGGGQLGLADGPNSSQISLSHNFATGASGAAILSAGGYAVSVELSANNGTANDISRWVGFGIGLTDLDIASYGVDFDAPNGTPAGPGLRGHQSGTTAGSGVSDFFIAATRTGAEPDNQVNFTIWYNGISTFNFTQLDGGGDILVGDILRVEFALSSFAAGSLVTPSITYGGVPVGGAEDLSFNLESDDAGYLGISARQNNEGWAIDNLVVETVPEPSVSLLAGLGVFGLLGRRRRV